MFEVWPVLKRLHHGLGQVFEWLKGFLGILGKHPQGFVATPYWKTLNVSDQALKGIQRDVDALVACGLVGRPTDDQWAMILTGHPVNRVIAAAGSGKSSTLLLRLLFLYRHMGINPEHISVFSFTAASCENLRNNITQWSEVIDINSKDIKKLCACITTFHARLRQSTLDHFNAFEWVGQNQVKKNRPAGFESNLNENQMRLINQAYVLACTDDADFTSHLSHLLEYTLDDTRLHGGWNQDTSTLNIKLAAQRDASLRLKIRQMLMQKGLWCDELDASDEASFSARHYRLGATAQLPDGRLVFVDELMVQQNWFSNEDQTHFFSTIEGLKTRIQLISQYCFKPYFFVQSMDQWQQIIQLVQLEHRRPKLRHHSTASKVAEAPYFTLHLDGETGAMTFAMHAYRIGSWMLSLGLDPQIPLRTARLTPLESTFLNMLPGFWKAFRTILKQNQIILYSDQFKLAAKRNVPEPWAQYLLIDEFQDVSPEIMNWILAIQKQHQQQGASLMVIGDDWQSIYAWRGSTPQILLNLQQHACAPWREEPVRTITLSENFRSTQAIIEDAHQVIRHIRLRSEKNVFSRRPQDPNHTGLQIWDLSEQESRQIFVQGLIQLIDHELQTLDRINGKAYGSILIMTRKRDILNKISAQIPKHWQSRVQLHTLHSAKGLQAETAILIDDCMADHSGAIRELIYQHADKKTKYEQMLWDEAHRLAYVGMTRAMYRLIWVVRDKNINPSGVLKYFTDTPIPVRTIPVLNKMNTQPLILAELPQIRTQ